MKGFCMSVVFVCLGYVTQLTNASVSDVIFRRETEFEANNYTAGDVIHTSDLDPDSCVVRCQETASCVAVLARGGVCTTLKTPLGSGPLQSDDIKYFVKEVQTSEEYKFSAAFGLSYKVHYDTLNHTQAKASCQSEGGSLLKIDTPDKQQYVEDTMDLQYYRMGYNVFYVDGEQLSVGGHGTGWWVFSDGSPVPILYWAPGQPNLSEPKVIRVNLHKDRKWDDGTGTNKRAYICQKP